MGKRYEENETDGSIKIIINRKNRKPLALGHQERDNGCGRFDGRPRRRRTRNSDFRQYLKENEDA